MKVTLSSAVTLAAVAILGTAVFAQTTGAGQTPAQPQSQAATSAPRQESEITVVGCVVREADYRRTHDQGRGGAMGTGVGVGNEFVLANARKASAGTPETPAETPTGTSGAASTAGLAYELTGANEGQVEQFVGRRVEITGTLKAGERGATGPTGGPTAGTPPSGIDVTSKDLKLKELEVTSVRETTGTCPSVQN
ncbi:MAG: hypothetical protein HYU53_05975 [Acidobacteria bacterium]|nr:hypothetical protein [Acidobacteriota bacterium]